MKYIEEIKEHLLSMCNTKEESLSEIKRYVAHFPKEPDYNIVQYGNLLVYYNQIREFYRNCDCKSIANLNDDKIWETYKRHVGDAVNQILKENAV